MLVRSLELADMPMILEVQSGAYAPSLLEPASSFEEKLALFPRGAIGGLDDGGHLLGYGVTLPWRGDDVVPLSEAIGAIPSDPDAIYIHDVATSLHARGTGVARQLVERIFAIASEMGITRFSLVAVQGSEPFWMHFGFRPAREFEYAPGVTATRMTLERPVS